MDHRESRKITMTIRAILLIKIDKQVRKINCFGRKCKRMPIYLPGIYSNGKDQIKATNKMSYVVSHIINCNARKIIDFSTNIGILSIIGIHTIQRKPLQKNNCQNEGANG